MPATMTIKCSHCGTQTSAHFFGAVRTKETRFISHTTSYPYWDVLLRCTSCQRGNLLTVWSKMDLTVVSSGFLDDVINPTRQWPEPQSPNIPNYLPDDVAAVYEEAQRLLHLKADGAVFYEPAMHSYRRALDLATKHLTGSDKHIRVRIKKLFEDGLIPETLSDLAHHVRIGGNDAAHDAPMPINIAKEEAHDLAEFTELFLTYTFSLPNRIDERNERAAQRKANEINADKNVDDTETSCPKPVVDV